MVTRLKVWAYMAAVITGGMMACGCVPDLGSLFGGCGSGIAGKLLGSDWIRAILLEDMIIH